MTEENTQEDTQQDEKNKNIQSRLKIPNIPKIGDAQSIIALLILATIILSIVPLMRTTTNGIFFGIEPYHNHIQESIEEKQDVPNDKVSQNVVDMDKYLLEFFSMIFSKDTKEIISIILAGIMALISIWLLYNILSALNIDYHARIVAVLIFILSPSFIYWFSFFSATSFTISIIFFSAYLLVKKNFTLWKPIYYTTLVFLSLTGIGYCLVAFGMILLFYSLQKEKRNLGDMFASGGVLIILPILISFVLYSKFLFNLPGDDFILDHSKTVVSSLISVFGSIGGLSLFGIILCIPGIISYWHNKTSALYSILLMIFFSVISVYVNESIILFLCVITSIFAGIGLDSIIHIKWEYDILKSLTLLALFCGIIFSTMSYYNIASDGVPDEPLVTALHWLNTNTTNFGMIETNAPSDKQERVQKGVISYYENGFWINYFSGNIAVVDLRKTKDSELRLDKCMQIFYSRNLENTTKNLDDLSVKYIFLTPDMKSKVWGSRGTNDEGLLFLFRNKLYFTRLYSESGYEIWEYHKPR